MIGTGSVAAVADSCFRYFIALTCGYSGTLFCPPRDLREKNITKVAMRGAASLLKFKY